MAPPTCMAYRLLDSPRLEAAAKAIVEHACSELERDVWAEVSTLSESWGESRMEPTLFTHPMMLCHALTCVGT